MLSRDIHRRGMIIRILLFTIISFVFVSLIAFGESPFYGPTGCDGAVYKIMALGWMDGLIPYSHLFDNKGPYIYLIDMVGLWISPRYGIYFLEILNLTTALMISYSIGTLLSRKEKIVWIGILFVLAVSSRQYFEGNLTESWSLNFMMLPLYKYLKGEWEGGKGLWIMSLLLGGCFGIIAMMRINNGGVPASIGIVMFYRFIHDGHYKHALKLIIGVLLGVLATMTPVLAWFYCNDSLKDLWFAVFEVNMRYSQSELCWRQVLNSMVVFAPLWIFLPVAMKQTWHIDIKVFYIVALAINSVLFIPTMGFQHYFLVLYPLYLIIGIGLLNLYWGYKSAIAMAVLWLTCPGYYENKRMLRDFEYIDRTYSKDAPSLVKSATMMVKRHVPAKEYGDIFPMELGVEIGVWPELGIAPRSKYFSFEHLAVGPIQEGILKARSTNRSKWILCSKNIFRERKDWSRPKFLLERYEAVDSTTDVILFRRLQ